MTATTGVGGLIYGRALVDQRTGKKINFDDLKPDVVKQLVAQAQQSAEAAAESERLAGQHAGAVWLILPTVPTHTIDPKTKTITKLLRGDGGLSGLNGIIPIAGADEQVHEFKYFLQYSYLNN